MDMGKAKIGDDKKTKESVKKLKIKAEMGKEMKGKHRCFRQGNMTFRQAHRLLLVF